MAADQEGIGNELKGLAETADKLQGLFKGKATIIFELEEEEYVKSLNMFVGINKKSKQFKVDISGTDFLFILVSVENES